MTKASEYENDDERIIVIGNKQLKEYYWVIGLQFQFNRELILRFMMYRTALATRLIDLYTQFGVEEVKGSRKEVLVKSLSGQTLKVVECVIKKQGRLFP